MKIVSSLPLMILAGTVAAAPLPPKTNAPAAAAAAPVAKRFPGVSDDGNAVLAKAQTTPDPQLQSLGRQMRAAHDQLMAASMAPMIDVDKVTAALRAEETAQALVRAHNNDRLLGVLKQLPEGDRGIFLRTLVLARQPRPAGAPPAPIPQP